jgi:hypothetical protein
MNCRIALLLLCTAFLAVPAAAQFSRSQISGFVRDASGAVVPGAKVLLDIPSKALKRTTSTDNTGFYVLPDLPGGTYQLTVEAKGFKTYIQTGIVLDSAAALAIDAKLEIGSLSQSVEVTAKLQEVQTGSTDVSHLLQPVQLTELPILGRNVLSLSGMLPGVIYRNGVMDDRGTSTSFGGFFINGLRKHFNFYTIDGLSNMQNDTLILWNNTISADFLQEFKVTTSAYSAEYSRSAGAQVNAVTKSGTRDFHGDAYEFVRNDKMNARSELQPWPTTIAPYKFNDFGWTLGGPVYIPGKWNKDKSKLFFFAGQEFRRVLSPANNVGIVPTAQERAGNFTGITPTPKDPTTGLAFPNNTIPTARMSVNGPKLANIYPLPNYTGPGGNFFSNVSAPTVHSDTIARLDWDIAPRWTLSMRDVYDNQWSVTPVGSASCVCESVATLYTQGDKSITPAHNGQIQLVTMISPSAVNEVLLGYSAFSTLATAYPGYATRAQYGINIPLVIAGNVNVGNMIPALSVQGMDPAAPAAVPIGNGKPGYVYRDNFTKVKGHHSLKFGAYVENGGTHLYNRGATYGSFSFNAATTNTLTTGNGMADMLLGNSDGYGETSVTPYDSYLYRNYEFYAQDSWKVRPNLTLDYGLRYSIFPPWYSQYNSMVAWDPAYFNPAQEPTVNPNGTIVPGSGNLLNGVVLGGSGFPSDAQGRVAASILNNPQDQALFHGLPRGFSTTNYGGIGPRLGIAWDPTGTGKMAVRAGFAEIQGRSDLQAITESEADYAPFLASSVGITNAPVDNPAAGIVGASVLTPLSFREAILDYKNPQVFDWHFDIQKELPGQIVLDVGYLGNHGVHESRGRETNILTPAQQQAIGSANPLPYLPYVGLSTIVMAEPSDSSVYDALVVKVTRRLYQGLLFNASYTLAKAIAGADDRWDEPQNQFNLRAERSYNEDDRRNVLVINSVYNIPLFKSLRGVPGGILKGWEVATIANFGSGRHFQPSLTGAVGQIASRPNLIGNFTLPKSQKNLYHFFNTSAFARPAAYTYGSAGRFIIAGPGTNDWDMNLSKNWKIYERATLQFRAEAFSLFNHPNFNGLNTTFGSSAFGQVNSVNSGRIIELGMKLVF